MTTVTGGAAGVGGFVGGQAAQARIDTRTCRRRLVAYKCLGCLSKDLDAVEGAHRAGTLTALGNHGVGAIFDHLAKAMARSFDGFGVTAPAPLRWIGPLLKKGVLGKPFKPGFNLRKDLERFAWDDSVSVDEGLRRLREQIARAQTPGAAPNASHPFFGVMTPAEWQTYYLRHAELHMSFLSLRPEAQPIRR